MKLFSYFIGLCALLFSLTLHAASLNFAPYLTHDRDIPVVVTKVTHDDVLNLRAEPHHQATIKFRIPYNATNLVSYDPDILNKVGKNHWVSLRVGADDGYIDGFVNARFLKLATDYQTIQSPSLTVKAPYFLEHQITDKQWLKLSKKISLNHYSGCDMRDNPTLKHEWALFEVEFKAYEQLKTALTELFDYDLANVLSYLDTQTNWFKPNQGSYFEPSQDFGKQSYKVSMGAEGCGLEIYFFQHKGRILVMQKPFDRNLPQVVGGELAPQQWSAQNMQNITNQLLKSIR